MAGAIVDCETGVEGAGEMVGSGESSGESTSGDRSRLVGLDRDVMLV